MSSPVTVIATYRVRAGKESEFLALLDRHHPTLKQLGLVTDEAPVVYLGHEKGAGEPIVFEIFSWLDAAAPDQAHELPEVMRLWEPMGTLCEERGGRPKWMFPHVRRLTAPSGA